MGRRKTRKPIANPEGGAATCGFYRRKGTRMTLTAFALVIWTALAAGAPAAATDLSGEWSFDVQSQ